MRQKVFVAMACYTKQYMSIVERIANRIESAPIPNIPQEAIDFVQEIGVIDLHCDSLLFGKDLTVTKGIGHIDIPRLLQGNVQLQIHAVATKLPLGFNHTHTIDRQIDLLSILYAILFSKMAFMSPNNRLHYQAARMKGMCTRSDNAVFINNQSFKLEKGKTAVLLGFEGAQGVGNQPENITKLYADGYRIAGLSHFHDNLYCGSHHGENKNGLSQKGHKLVELALRLNMIIDLAHGSKQTIRDVCQYKKPVLCSHTGLLGHYTSDRNILDEDAKRIADVGGVIGIGFWEDAVGSSSVSDIVDAIEYGIKTAGVHAIGLGSDFDGGIRTVADTSLMPYLIVAEMFHRKIPPRMIEAVIFKNAHRILKDNLPT